MSRDEHHRDEDQTKHYPRPRRRRRGVMLMDSEAGLEAVIQHLARRAKRRG